MAIVHCFNKRTGVTYVYESHNFWDKEAKKYKARRKLLGKLDENGDLIPTGPKGRPKKERTATPSQSPEEYSIQEALEESNRSIENLRARYAEDITRLYEEIDALKKELRKSIQRQHAAISSIQETIAILEEP